LLPSVDIDLCPQNVAVELDLFLKHIDSHCCPLSTSIFARRKNRRAKDIKHSRHTLMLAHEVEAAATRNFAALFDKFAHTPQQVNLLRDIDRAVRELAVFCDGAFPPHDTHEVHAEIADLAAGMLRRDFVSPERLAQFAQLRALVERAWTARTKNARYTDTFPPITHLAQHEYTRVLLRFDLALVRFKVQVLLQQIQD
jgi:hypothetical protein